MFLSLSWLWMCEISFAASLQKGHPNLKKNNTVQITFLAELGNLESFDNMLFFSKDFPLQATCGGNFPKILVYLFRLVRRKNLNKKRRR